MSRRLLKATGTLLAVLVCACVYSTAKADTPSITVVYPKPGQVVGAVDSTFIFGHISGVDEVEDYRLTIGGQAVPIHEESGFLAFVPVVPGDFSFKLELYYKDDFKKRPHALPVASLDVPVKIPKPLETIPETELIIAGDYRAPRGDLVMTSGQRVEVMFRGTPGLQGWFEIPGVVDSVPVAETEPRTQPYWGESVFGVGAVPDSVKVRGIYSGFYDIKPGDQVSDTSIIYYLAPPDPVLIVARILQNPADTNVFRWLQMLSDEQPISQRSSYRVSINPPDYPFAVRFVDSVQTIRYGPRQGYFAIFQPEGLVAMAVGAEGNWYRLRVSPNQYAWAAMESVEELPRGILPPHSLIRSLRTYGSERKVTVEIPLSGIHPYRVIEEDRRTIRLQLFNVRTDTDWIRYDFADPFVRLATWFQPEPEVYELKIELTDKLWGFDTYYRSNTFYLELIKPPKDVDDFRDKVIVVDPGHSRDPGAVGPTGLTEAEANLGISLVLARALERRGAKVIMTRTDTSHVDLYDRPAIAKASEADLFISVHNNALPDGVNPFENNGVSAYYYHPHSIDLARQIQKQMIKETKLPDHGLFHGNLAVNRPTQYPAVLVECAFMMIPEQEAKLKTEDFRWKVSKAIIKGIEEFLERYDDDDW